MIKKFYFLFLVICLTMQAMQEDSWIIKVRSSQNDFSNTILAPFMVPAEFIKKSSVLSDLIEGTGSSRSIDISGLLLTAY